MRRLAGAAVLAAAIAGPGLVAVTAQVGGGYGLTWSAFTGGGGRSANDTYAVEGAIGQPFASSSSGGGYAVDSGFFAGGGQRFRLFIPIIAKDED